MAVAPRHVSSVGCSGFVWAEAPLACRRSWSTFTCDETHALCAMGVWEASVRRLGSICEAFGKHL
eukprot:6182994-Pleurochrysis_carterae.AAC.2